MASRPTTLEAVMHDALAQREALLAYAYALVRDWALADDLVQEVYVDILRVWGDYDSERPLLPWLRRFVHLKGLAALRARGRDRAPGGSAYLEQVAAVFAAHQDDEPDAHRPALAAALTTCVESLPRPQRELIRSVYAEGRPVTEVAVEQGRSENALYLLLSRLRRQLRACAERRLIQGRA